VKAGKKSPSGQGWYTFPKASSIIELTDAYVVALHLKCIKRSFFFNSSHVNSNFKMISGKNPKNLSFYSSKLATI
jgi:hypothetical protein